MPFITQERRDLMSKGQITEPHPGDRCFVHYSRMVAMWHESRRWTTAHELYRAMLLRRPYESLDETIAEELAWQVFFQLHIMPYEEEKRRENGDI